MEDGGQRNLRGSCWSADEIEGAHPSRVQPLASDHCIGRRQSPVRGDISVATAVNNCPAPSGAAWSGGTTQSLLPPILGVKRGKMSPLTGLYLLGSAFPTKMPRLRRSRCPGRRERSKERSGAAAKESSSRSLRRDEWSLYGSRRSSFKGNRHAQSPRAASKTFLERLLTLNSVLCLPDFAQFDRRPFMSGDTTTLPSSPSHNSTP